MRTLLGRLLADQRGMESIEVAVVGALIAVGLVAAFPTLMAAITSGFTKVSTEIANAK